jgi:hypothetical protein
MWGFPLYRAEQAGVWCVCVEICISVGGLILSPVLIYYLPLLYLIILYIIKKKKYIIYIYIYTVTRE